MSQSVNEPPIGSAYMYNYNIILETLTYPFNFEDDLDYDLNTRPRLWSFIPLII